MGWTGKNTSDHKKSPTSIKSASIHSSTGRKQEKSPQLGHGEVIGDSSSQKFSPKQMKIQGKEKSATVESMDPPKEKICRDKLSSSKKSTLITRLSKILDQGSIAKGKDLTPFWTQESKELSEKLWLPTETDSVESILSSSKESSKSTPRGKSWFSIKKRLPPKKNLSEISSPLLQYSPEDSMVSGVTPYKRKIRAEALKNTETEDLPKPKSKGNTSVDV